MEKPERSVKFAIIYVGWSPSHFIFL